MKKLKEVFHEWEQLNMNTLLFNKVVDVPVVQVVIWFRPFLDKVADMPVVCYDRGLCDSKVPQTHFIAELEDIPVVQQRRCAHSAYCAAGSVGAAYGGGGGDEGAFFGLGPFFVLLQISGIARLGCGGDAGSLDSQAFCRRAAQSIRRHLVDMHSVLR